VRARKRFGALDRRPSRYFGGGVVGGFVEVVVGLGSVGMGLDGDGLVDVAGGVGFGGVVAGFERARLRVVLRVGSDDVVNDVFTVGCERTHVALHVARSPSLPEHAD
jgi:hypothetical protein